MKKIGILTYHRSINYGAVMQAYSLSERIAAEFPECKVEIIDYMSKAAETLYHPGFFAYIRLAMSKESFKEKAIFLKQAFIYLFRSMTGRRDYELNRIFEEHLKSLRLSDEYIVTDDEKEFFEKIKDKYDVVIVGSDAVFNWQIRTFPSPYFIAGDIGALKFSYAASSYGQEYTTVTDYQKKYIADAWRQFSYLGVRDKTTEEFIRFADSSLVPHHNCDPTVFLDIDSVPIDDAEIRSLFLKKGIDLNKPIIGIMSQDWLGKIVRDIFDDSYQIVAVFKDNQYADFYLDNLTPFEWSKVFKYFSVTFTHFFHGNLLSLKNGTPTIVIENRSAYNAAHNSKVRDLMSRIGLFDFCYYRDEISEKRDEIVKAVENRISNRSEFRKRISDGLEKEAESFYGFRDALKAVLDSIDER